MTKEFIERLNTPLTDQDRQRYLKQLENIHSSHLEVRINPSDSPLETVAKVSKLRAYRGLERALWGIVRER